MKKYKHKITGDIVQERSNLDSRFYTNEVHSIPALFVESGNDWEEVKFYKILKLSSKKENDAHPVGTIIDYFNSDSNLWQEYWSIYSIERLSDGAVFSIGDKVFETITGKKDSWVIKEFSLKDTRCFSCGVNIENLEHKKEPIFITEDGFEMFEDSKYYTVFHKPSPDIKPFTVFGPFQFNMQEHGNLNFKDVKYFNSLGYAEIWIKENKPQYSEKQVVNILRGFDMDILNNDREKDEYYLPYITKYK